MMSRIPPVALFAAHLLFAPGLALAHVGAGAGDTDVLPHPGDADAVLLEAPWGLVVGGEDGFDWICHEVLSNGVAELPEFEMSRDGVLLGVTGLLTGVVTEDESLYRSADGCSWEAVSGTSGRVIQDAAFDPDDGDLAIAVTSDPIVVGEPITSTIFRSTDAGLTFTAVHTVQGGLFQEVRFGTGGRVYALAARQDPLEAVLLRSDDAGLSWVERPVPGESLETPGFGKIAAVDPSDHDEVWLSFDGSALDGVLRTLDGGESFEALDLPASSVLDITLVDDGAAWLVGDSRQLWTSPDRATWTEQTTAPQVWGGAWSGSALRLAVNTLSHDEALVQTSDGQDYETLLSTLDLRGPLACPAGSEVATVCEPLWPSLRRSLELMRPSPSGDDDDDSADPVDPTECGGCSTAAGAGGSWLLLALALAARRRPRRTLSARSVARPTTAPPAARP